RANSCATYPADFQLICAMNPCRCGFLGDPYKECKKAPLCGEEYKSKISGPLLDRIDIVVEVAQIDYFAEIESVKSENSESIRNRVLVVRDIQKQRFSAFSEFDKTVMLNSKIEGKFFDIFCEIDDSSKNILQSFVNRHKTSMRGINRILRVARTIADMDYSTKIQQKHIMEAMSYRRRI
ncbi:MAG: ATP-binding protein, partial [Alphaproteobacteria bacterium]|nr:ATP-binding protein [Alphaproteobacteria bacterium]